MFHELGIWDEHPTDQPVEPLTIHFNRIIVHARGLRRRARCCK